MELHYYSKQGVPIHCIVPSQHCGLKVVVFARNLDTCCVQVLVHPGLKSVAVIIYAVVTALVKYVHPLFGALNSYVPVLTTTCS